MAEWSVHAEADIGQAAVEGAADALTEQLTAQAGDVAETPAGRLSVQMHLQAATLRKAFDAAVKALTEALHEQGLPARITRVTVMAWHEFEAELAIPRVPPLVGIAEIAVILGVSKQRARQITQEHAAELPEVARVAAGPLYAEAAVTAYAAKDRKRGRPRKTATG